MGDLHPTLPPSVVPGVARITVPEQDPVEGPIRGHRMDTMRELLEAVRTAGLATGKFRGLLHIAIGRTVTKSDGTKVSAGVTWRELASVLKTLRYDPELGREAGADPDTLSPRDRERYWYAVIALAHVDSAEARTEADQLVAPLKAAGFVVAPAAGASAPEKPRPAVKKVEKTDEKGKKKKK